MCPYLCECMEAKTGQKNKNKFKCNSSEFMSLKYLIWNPTLSIVGWIPHLKNVQHILKSEILKNYRLENLMFR